MLPTQEKQFRSKAIPVLRLVRTLCQTSIGDDEIDMVSVNFAAEQLKGLQAMRVTAEKKEEAEIAAQKKK